MSAAITRANVKYFFMGIIVYQDFLEVKLKFSDLPSSMVIIFCRINDGLVMPENCSGKDLPLQKKEQDNGA